MTPMISLGNAVLAVTAGVLLYIAVIDLKRYTIPNALIIVLVALFFVYTAVSERWSVLPWNLAIAALIFVVQLYFYARSWVGGGDVKMLAVAFLWIGADCALSFAILLCLFASIHGLAAKLKWAPFQQQAANDARVRIPFAPAIAAAMIGTFMLSCLYRPA
jgi:prepilin peptidase CpaA